MVCTPDEELAEAKRLVRELRAAPPSAGELWAERPPPPPLPEAAVSALRRRARLAALHLDGLAPDLGPARSLFASPLPMSCLAWPPVEWQNAFFAGNLQRASKVPVAEQLKNAHRMFESWAGGGALSDRN